MTTQRELNKAARQLADLLQRRQQRIVFAESCTGGLVSATLTKIPGISEFHCGSAVVYRIGTKNQWLGIARSILKKPGPVSRIVAAEMAERVLAKTPEAKIAASVTGHLGPDAPRLQDGLIYVGVALRNTGRSTRRPKVVVRKHRLDTAVVGQGQSSGRSLRNRRQLAAAQFVLETACTVLAE